MQKKETWFKPYILNPHNIEKVVQPGMPGVYVLGNMDENKKLRIKHIRSSGSVKEELKKNLGRFHLFMYKPFKHQLQQFAKGQQTLQFV